MQRNENASSHKLAYFHNSVASVPSEIILVTVLENCHFSINGKFLKIP